MLFENHNFMVAEKVALPKVSGEVVVGSQVTIIVPCYNEELRLNRVAYVSFAMANPGIKFVFVNDGSTDATLDVLHQMQRAVPQQIEVFSLAQNSGKAEAVRQGLQHVSSRGDELIAYWDADLATPLDAVFDFVNIGNCAEFCA